mmetsp:Transcript_18157/g.20960  ORF Transcript_18157/g.20960 Transcript_18157/m.20960 type:complete len:857 (-) Transcript_18157:40-2610(-)
MTSISDIEESRNQNTPLLLSTPPSIKGTDADESISVNIAKDVIHNGSLSGETHQSFNGETDDSGLQENKNTDDLGLQKNNNSDDDTLCQQKAGKMFNATNEVQSNNILVNKPDIFHEPSEVFATKTRSYQLNELTEESMPHSINHNHEREKNEVKNSRSITFDTSGIESDEENTNSIDSICHPSKLTNENSASTHQPDSLETHIMSINSTQQVLEDTKVDTKNEHPLYGRKGSDCSADNLILSEVNADRELSKFQNENSIFSEIESKERRVEGRMSKESSAGSLGGPDFSIGSNKELLSDVSNQVFDGIQSVIEAPKSSSGNITPVSSLGEGLRSESDVRLSQQVGMVIHQPHSEPNLPPLTALRHGSFGYTQTQIQPPAHSQIQMPMVQQGSTHNIPPTMQHIPAQMVPNAPLSDPQSLPLRGTVGGRRRIIFRLEEDAKCHSKKGFFFRRRKTSFDSLRPIEESGIDRGVLAVSWFEGTSTSELQEHVIKSLARKLHLDVSTQLADFRIIDRSEDPPQEIVLSPFIPDGSTFVLRFSTQTADKLSYSSDLNEQNASEKSSPRVPSAAPSPYQSNVDLKRLNEEFLRSPKEIKEDRTKTDNFSNELEGKKGEGYSVKNKIKKKKVDEADTASGTSAFDSEGIMGYNPEDQIEARLRQLADLIISDRKSRSDERRRSEKRQVVFVIANYLAFFLTLIALSAELSARAPKWLKWGVDHLENVQKCSDQDALFECVSKGDFAGLVASFILWLSRSTATKRFFLFGFETPQKLWTVVYESMVTAVCWGISYIVIRRGMNPDTRNGVVRKYWKDAVYGSLAGFNASFMKQVLKNLIPQEALEDALQDRQLKILGWLPSFH